eukprot:7902013-Alexandrium_andersonii.AAC.1
MAKVGARGTLREEWRLWPPGNLGLQTVADSAAQRGPFGLLGGLGDRGLPGLGLGPIGQLRSEGLASCLLYTSDAADDM